MKKALVIIIVIAVGIAILHTTTRTNQPSPSDTPLISAEITTKDVAYGSDPLQRFTITYNPGASTPQPLAVIIHGGGWTSGDRKPFMDTFGPFFRNNGFGAMSVNYRLAPSFHYPTQPEDVACAISSVVADAKKYNIDTDRIIILGHSAGAHLGALVAYTSERDWLSSCISKTKFHIAGFIGLSGVYDFDLLPKDRELEGLTAFLGEKYQSGKWDEAEPINAVDRKDPPTLLIHGDKDTFVNFQQSVAMDRALRDAGATSELMLVKGADHNAPYQRFKTATEVQSRIAEFLKKI